MDDLVFEKCSEINVTLQQGKESDARNLLIKLLGYMSIHNIKYTPLVNALIREVGLYPYMDEATTNWNDAFAYNLFKVDVGLDEDKPLHREQYRLLSALLEGKDIAVSAPTSFGKSFVVDAFIRIKRPANVMIIVPTIALTDETRRRIYKKFANEYNIITTTDEDLKEKNIFIFPQERALHYIDLLESIDILIVDEFYKSSKAFEKERAANLIKAIIKIGEKAKQRYYLAPNISKIENNPFTSDMEFMKLDFNTVYLTVNDYYPEILNDNVKKGEKFMELTKVIQGKTLIYAGSYSNINKVSDLLLANTCENNSELLKSFSDWLGRNYDYSWYLTLLTKRGIGIHNGQLHRSLSQIQVKLFEEEKDGIDKLISTSSIIEGVNTSAENVIVWATTGRGLRFNNFSYKNLIGRAGRMFRYFIGHIYVLAKPPVDTDTQLNIPFPEEILGTLDKEKCSKVLTRDQVAKISEYDREMENIMGEVYHEYKKDSVIQSQDAELIRTIAGKLHNNPEGWKEIQWLNNQNPDYWDGALLKILLLQPGSWETSYRDYIAFVKVLTKNWTSTIPDMLAELEQYNIGIDMFFKLERNVTFNLSSLVGDLNKLQKVILQRGYDISSFKNRLSSAFLPPVVYTLEEYGLPRMISRKIQDSGIINFEDYDLNLKTAIEQFQQIGCDRMKFLLKLDKFESYILDYFYDGITSAQSEEVDFKK